MWRPKWSALMLGFGALFAGEAHAELHLPSAGTNSRSSVAEVAIRTDGGKVYISQRGGPFEELLLGNTPEAVHLRKLLKDAGAAEGPISVPIDPIIVANGGAAQDGKKPTTDDKQPDKKVKQPSKPEKDK